MLTFANKVKSFSPDHFTKWKESLQSALVEGGISEKVAKNIPIVPAGYTKEPATSCDCWLSKLWFQLLPPILMKINKERDNLIATMIDDFGSKELHILVTVRTGAGKSALINSIIGKDVTAESELPLKDSAETKGVIKCENKSRKL